MAMQISDLKSKWQRDPDATVRLIVRVTDNPSAHVAQVEAHGLVVRYTYSLISALAVQGAAAAALALANEPWIISIEEDKPVRTMPMAGGTNAKPI